MTGRKILGILGVCLAVLGSDIALKAYTFYNIPLMTWAFPSYPYGGIPVFHNWFGIDFSLSYAMNKGAAWGILSSFQHYLLYLRFLIMAGIFLYLVVVKMPFVKKLALSLVLTGALGNVLDFFLYKHVVDMFLFCFWGYIFPVFNIADVSIFCGVVLLLFHGLWDKKKSSSCKGRL